MTDDLAENTTYGAQRMGQIVDRQPFGSGQHGRSNTYAVRDSDTGTHYSFSYVDIVTEGFRHIRVGEHVRFFLDPDHPTRARYVIQLDQPDIESFYQ